MLIKYLVPAPNGINLISFGSAENGDERVYDFQPDAQGNYLCEVDDDGDAATMLAITEGFESPAAVKAAADAKAAAIEAEAAIVAKLEADAAEQKGEPPAKE